MSSYQPSVLSRPDSVASADKRRDRSPAHLPPSTHGPGAGGARVSRGPRAGTPDEDDEPPPVPPLTVRRLAPSAGVSSPSILKSPVTTSVTGCTAAVAGHEVTRDERDGAPYAVYRVEVLLNDQPYVVKRRFNQFVELRKQVWVGGRGGR